MTALHIAGPVARLDTPTDDPAPRQLARTGYTPPGGELPLMALLAGFRPGQGHFGAEPVGTVTDWSVDDEGLLSVVGEVFDDQRVPAGSYVCGLDTRFDHAEVEVEASGLMVVRKWQPVAVTLHLPGSAGRNAWPDLPPLVVSVPEKG